MATVLATVCFLETKLRFGCTGLRIDSTFVVDITASLIEIMVRAARDGPGDYEYAKPPFTTAPPLPAARHKLRVNTALAATGPSHAAHSAMCWTVRSAQPNVSKLGKRSRSV